jgi:hypothetical protein
MIGRLLVFVLLLAFPSLSRADAPSPVTESVDPAIQRSVNDIAKFVIRTVARGRPVGVLPFDTVGEEARKLRIGEAMGTLVTQALVQSRQVRVAETQDIERILQEIRLSTLGIIDSRSAVKVGNMVGAQVMLSGTVIPAGEVYQVAVRLNDVGTAQTLGAATVEIPRRKLIALTRDVYNIHQGWYEAPVRSLLVPGWGQMYNDRPVRGGLYLGGAVLLLGGAAVAAVQADRRLEAYHEAGRDTAEARFTSYEKAVKLSNGLLIAGAALWTLNVIDAAWAGPVEEDFSVTLTPSEVRFALRF